MRRNESPFGTAQGGAVPALTIAWHPDPRRIGACAFLPELDTGHPVKLSRLEPDFVEPSAPASGRRPLADATISRKPMKLRLDEDRLLLRPDPDGTPVTLDGALLGQPTTVEAAGLERGIILILAERIALLFHRRALPVTARSQYDLLGESDRLQQLRRMIDRLADTDLSVLVRGDPGTGKERVVRAIHASSNRAAGPLVTVNMVTVPRAADAAKLFGQRRMTLDQSTPPPTDFFTRAHGGTLFLDELGETPLDVQAVLLRAIENAENRADIDVRLVAATERDLDEEVKRGRFRAPLLSRVSGTTLEVPGLYARRDDVPRLLEHFLGEELERAGARDLLGRRDPDQPMWLHPELVAHLMNYPWPGNVSELRRVAQHMVSANRGSPVVQFDPFLQSLIGLGTPPPTLRDDTDRAPG